MGEVFKEGVAYVRHTWPVRTLILTLAMVNLTASAYAVLLPVFGLVQRVGAVSQADIEATLNMGVGMVVVLPAGSVAAATALLDARGVGSWVLGEVSAATGEPASVEVSGSHPAR